MGFNRKYQNNATRETRFGKFKITSWLWPLNYFSLLKSQLFAAIWTAINPRYDFLARTTEKRPTNTSFYLCMSFYNYTNENMRYRQHLGTDIRYIRLYLIKYNNIIYQLLFAYCSFQKILVYSFSLLLFPHFPLYWICLFGISVTFSDSAVSDTALWWLSFVRTQRVVGEFKY